MAKAAGGTIEGSEQQILSRLGSTGSGAAAFSGVAFLILAIVIAFQAAGEVNAARAEEAEGRLDHVLAAPVSRSRWFARVSRIVGSNRSLIFWGSTTVSPQLAGTFHQLATFGGSERTYSDIFLRMVGYAAASWGLFGSFAAVGFELCNTLRGDGRWPWHRPSKPKVGEIPEAGAAGYAVAAGIRLIIGAGLAWAAASTGQISGSLGAMIVGVAAPKIVEQLAKTIPLSITPELHGLDAAANPVSSARKHEESLLPTIDVDGAARAVD